MEIHGLDLSRRLAVLVDGRTVPIVGLFDHLGEEIASIEAAVSFVCGEGREWLSDLIERHDLLAMK